MYSKLCHVGHLVKDLDSALKFYREVFNLEPSAMGIVEVQTEHNHLRTAMLPLGTNFIELIQPVGDAGELAQRLKEKGEGLYHIALFADRFEEAVEDIQQKGYTMIVKKFEYQGVEQQNAFFVPEETMGAPIELLDAQNLPAMFKQS